MVKRERLICAAAEVLEQGKGVVFSLDDAGHENGFVVRYNGRAHGYVNRCAHVPVPLDWQEGEFFDLTRHNLICATHGAQYEPDSGLCVLGPCRGKSLQKLEIEERNGQIYWITETDHHE